MRFEPSRRRAMFSTRRSCRPPPTASSTEPGARRTRLPQYFVLDIVGKLLDRGPVAAVTDQDRAIDVGQLRQRRVFPDGELVSDRTPARHHHHPEPGRDRSHQADLAVRGEDEIAVETGAM